ncbi:hypothetical protein BN871_DW_00040 [Paenibacillus sp. P22]|nr:hypothetical protein BN871_DW_00040 [Paenibacillus sp. P22]
MKRMLTRASLSWMLMLALIVSLLPAGAAPASAAPDTASALRQAGQTLLKSGISSDWDAIAASQAGLELPASYAAGLAKTVRTEAAGFTKVTDLERTALAVTAIGEDASSFQGVNLIERIANSSRMTSQGVNGPIYALLALDYGAYEVPAAAKWTREALVAEVLKHQAQDGSFAFDGEKSGNPDLTGAALTALAPYLDKPEAKQAGERIVSWLAKQQDKDGGFTSYGESSSESIAQIVIGLASAGVDPADSRFVQNGKGLLDKLFTFRNADGSFSHSLPLAANAYGAYQSVQALTAYEKFKNGTGRLYAKPAPSVTVSVEGPNATLLASGVARAVYALDALTQAASDAKLAVEVKSMQFGKYVASIGGIEGGKFGGYDGWLFAVQRGGAWITPSVGMGDFALQKGDRLAVFYGDNTQLISSAAVSPRQPRDNEAFTVQVSQQTWDYTANAYTVTPAAGVSVKAGSVTATADAYGTARFQAMPAGSYDLTVTGYSDAKAPSVLKHVQKLTVGSTSALFSDEKEIAAWARDSVHDGYASGLISGISGNGAAPAFAPKQKLTRAEFASLIVRLLGLEPASSASAAFTDVKAGSWYEQAVVTASASGILTGTGGGKFQPDAPISRQDMAVIFARALKLDLSAAPSGDIRDIKSVSAYAASSVNAVHGTELMVGDKDGNFNPKATVTREMAAVAILNAYESLAKAAN